jgi:tRNA pseudouridine13 synthase
MDYSGTSLSALEARWPRAWGDVQGDGVIRQNIDDFLVEEQPLVTPSGEGEHLWLWVEKAGANTGWVASQLAELAGIQNRDVSFAGRKDRHARTWQFFSLHMPGMEDPHWQDWNIEGVTVLSGTRHSKKLRRGHLAGNRFKLVIRELTDSPGRLDQKLERIASSGVPNYFGQQRFGRNGANIHKARQLLMERRRFPRNLQNMLISSARSLVFNDVVADRVNNGSWNSILPGDIVQLAGTRSRFVVAVPDDELLQRCNDFDITATGPMPGDDEAGFSAPAEELSAVAEHVEWITSLRNMRVASDRRPLRLAPENLHWVHGERSLEIEFTLAAGSYATTVLREITGCRDGAVDRHRDQEN